MTTATPTVDPSERFAMVPATILFDTTMPPTLRLVYAAVALHADQTTGRCFFTQRKLAERLGMTRETLNKHLRRLVEAGHLDIISRTASDRGWDDSNRRTYSDYVLRTRVHGPKRVEKGEKSHRQSGYDVAEAVDAMGTNYRPDGLRGREPHMVASAVAGAMDSGMSHMEAHDALVELVNETPTLPTAEDVIGRAQEIRYLRETCETRGVDADEAVQDPWSMY